ncbi:XRE family transcriptional regulator [Pandoraea bronchicola]|uniref:XRE family transcriptional regulator n=1 Tax=Pandoraea bronchicola TaxID=2508287 RepID=A0A5E5BVW7_9BURK|nr:XRE family transcriptional regulator [Pandoraea bronchicola]VVE89487.1 XRE family transcriptional regulator [Pandoraea bronchicola]
MSDTNIEGGGTNVYADLDYANPTAMVQKAALVAAITERIEALSISVDEAAKTAQVTAPKMLAMLGGRFRDISLEDIRSCAHSLGVPLS